MKKLKLAPDDLCVASFETSNRGHEAGGTVRANDAWTQFDPTCGGLSCDVACRTRYQNTCLTACAA